MRIIGQGSQDGDTEPTGNVNELNIADLNNSKVQYLEEDDFDDDDLERKAKTSRPCECGEHKEFSFMCQKAVEWYGYYNDTTNI